MKRTMFLGASNLIFERAKELRDNMTSSELLLWGYLRQSPYGHKFRWQHPIADFIVDFYCHSLQLIIEVDGSVHLNEENQLRDKERQQYLESKKIVFLRFTNQDVEKHPEDVIKTIEAFIQNKVAK